MKKVIISLLLSTYLASATGELVDYPKDKNLLSASKINCFNKVIDFIKSHEGFRSNPYYCIGGYKTIGYGFITTYIPKEYRNHITKSEANIILNKKINNCYNIAKTDYPHLKHTQLLALAHLIYAKGHATLKQHSLHKQLKNDNVIDDTWINFGKYERKYETYRKNRIFELKLYKH